ncbi:MAG: heavy-metal-associated domain-containing protein [Deltaproteobacteria bacterium]|nr:heavy-metal-associated domain-containing protein [Deltaproteobacteria bacterium]
MKIGIISFGVFLMTWGFLQAEPQTIEMDIEGMTCSACSAIIKKKLSPLCSEVSVDHKSGHGSCTYESEKVTQDQILDVVSSAGYKATLEEPEPAQ